MGSRGLGRIASEEDKKETERGGKRNRGHRLMVGGYGDGD